MKRKFLVVLFMAVLTTVLVVGCSGGSGAAAQNGDRVAVHYTGTLDDGTVFDSSRDRGTPLEFVLGAGQMIAGFDRAVAGMKVGQTKKVILPPEEAYGEYREDMVAVFDRDRVPEGMDVQVGQQLTLQTDDGGIITATVIEVSAESITLDANHRLAGKELTFEIELVSITPAE